MGALHERATLALVRERRGPECGPGSFATIFVNPKQFAPDRGSRSLFRAREAADLAMLQAAGVAPRLHARPFAEILPAPGFVDHGAGSRA